jgi:uncharacterized protein YlaI
MRCTACGAELILTDVVPDDTARIRGCEHHTFICPGCHDDRMPLPESVKDGHFAFSGLELLDRFV